ncbi:Translin-associated factor X-interacting protein 1 [Coelomomyces lativittatus]|nr:Translin-associated factor X-interacting protein 1 [Coelomomyces lativittatus]
MVDVKTNSILVKVSGEPPLLVELKRFIRNELKELNAECSPVGDQTRLSVYKHAFQSFLKEFKTYRAFLSEIKQEYDQHIDNLYLKLDKIYVLVTFYQKTSSSIIFSSCHFPS